MSAAATGSILLPLLISIPLTGGLLAFLAGGHARLPAIAGVVLNAGLAAALLMMLGEAVPEYAVGDWRPPLGIRLRADGLAALLVAVTALVTAVTTWYALGYWRAGSREDRTFWPLWCLLLAALNTLFLSADAFNLYVGLEVMSLSAVALVSLAGTLTAVRAALRYLLVGLIGSLCYLMGVALLYRAHGVLDLAALAAVSGSGPLEWSALALMSIGLLLKTALFPLHFWLPDAHASAPVPVSAALSGLVVKASFCLILRLWFAVLPSVAGPAAVLLIGALGAGAVLWGSLQALRSERLKVLVAYSSVSQVGYLFLLFPLIQPAETRAAALSAAVFFVLAHACAKAAMFLAAGNVLAAAGHDRLNALRDVDMHSGANRFALGIAGWSLIGLPPSGGFAAKWLLLEGAIRADAWWLFAVTLGGSLLAAGYVFRVLACCFDRSDRAVVSPASPRVAGRHGGGSPLVLALAALVLGFIGVPVLELLNAAAFGSPPGP